MKIAIIGMLLLCTTYTQAATPWIDLRQQRQHVRIERATAVGALRRPEARVLRLEQGHIRRLEWWIKADGVVTAGERALLLRRQDRASRHIARLSHSCRCRY